VIYGDYYIPSQKNKMQRSLTTLDPIQQQFIDIIYVQKRTFPEAALLLNKEIEVVRQLNKDLESHWRPVTKSFNKWKAKNVGGNFWDFHYWFINAKQCCHYCGITQLKLDELHSIGITNKRTTRGRSLEIDRKAPNEHYNNLNNLTYSCYWCNNAKTDTFTEEEFKIVGKAIGQIWTKRLNNDH
jgi:5-methylcytosine-specific restriction endonuclease McrA